MNKNTEQRAHAFEHLFEAVLITDPQGIITDCNASAEQVYGYERNEMIGQSFGTLIADDNADQIVASILKDTETNGQWQGELNKMGKKNHIGLTQTVTIPIFDSDQKLGSAIWINNDITNQVMLERRLSAMEYYDPLTGIPNRLVMYDRLQQLITTARRNQLMFALFFIDLDNFKEVNDTAGYSIGDAILRETAERMQSVLRQSDTVSRVGSDEFVVLAADIRLERDATTVEENINAAFKGVFIVGEREFNISASIGVVIYPRDGETSDDLLIKADKEMERKKLERMLEEETPD